MTLTRSRAGLRSEIACVVLATAWLLAGPSAVYGFEMSSASFELIGGNLNAGGSTELQNPGTGPTATAGVTIGQAEPIQVMRGSSTGTTLEPGFWHRPGGPPDCQDGLDNDGDGLTDFPDDPGCPFAEQNFENPECDDGVSNDFDGLVDFPDDPGCFSAAQNSETPICDDGLDNEGDGFCDMATSTCSDGSTPGDPDCATAWDASEASVVCGLGFELALLLPPLMWLRATRKHGGGPRKAV